MNWSSRWPMLVTITSLPNDRTNGSAVGWKCGHRPRKTLPRVVFSADERKKNNFENPKTDHAKRASRNYTNFYTFKQTRREPIVLANFSWSIQFSNRVSLKTSKTIIDHTGLSIRLIREHFLPTDRFATVETLSVVDLKWALLCAKWTSFGWDHRVWCGIGVFQKVNERLQRIHASLLLDCHWSLHTLRADYLIF